MILLMHNLNLKEIQMDSDGKTWISDRGCDEFGDMAVSLFSLRSLFSEFQDRI